MEVKSTENIQPNHNVPFLYKIPNPPSLHSVSPMIDGLEMNTFDGLKPSVNSGVSFEKNRIPCCDKCPNKPKNSPDLLKSFKQQWYKSRDSPKYKNLPFHTNICKRPPKIPRTNNSLQIDSAISSQEVSQVANVAPADPLMLEKIMRDPVGYINVQGKLREVRFYGEKSIVMMDWNDPRDVCFHSSSRRVIIDDKDIVILSFNSSYTNYTFPDGSTIKIRLGAPTRDFYIDGEPIDVKFGGPPANVLIKDSYHKIQLGGPNPKVYVGNVRRNDIMAGRINLIIDEDLNNIFHIYLDPKPQKFDINGVSYILRFADSLLTVLINERPFKTDFGGAPIAVKLYDEIHLLRFSALPPGVVPGLVHIANMESTKPDPVIRNLFPNILPVNDPKLTTLTSIANNNYYQFNYHYHSGGVTNGEVSLTKNADSISPSEKISGTGIQQKSDFVSNGIDVMDLYQKLVEKGLIQPPDCQKQTQNSRSILIDFSKPESLKHRNMRVVYELYSGAQCDICTLRFTRKSGDYSSHMDWHYQMKRHASEQTPNWWCHISEFPRSERDLDNRSWFEKQKRFNPFSMYEKLTVPAKDYGLMPKCSLCQEKFNQFYDEETDEWLLRNAVVHKRKLCHPICCFRENENGTTLLQVETNKNKPVHAKNNTNFCCGKSRGDGNVHIEAVQGLEQYDTILPCSVVSIEQTANAKRIESSIKENDNVAFPAEFEDSDTEEVVLIQSEMEIVDLSKEDLNQSVDNAIAENVTSQPKNGCQNIRPQVDGNQQNKLNGINCSKELNEGSFMTDSTLDDYNEIPSADPIKINPIPINLNPAHKFYNNSEDKEMEFNNRPRMNPGTVKPLLMDAMITVQPDVITGEITTSTCSIM